MSSVGNSKVCVCLPVGGLVLLVEVVDSCDWGFCVCDMIWGEDANEKERVIMRMCEWMRKTYNYFPTSSSLSNNHHVSISHIPLLLLHLPLHHLP